MTLNQLTYKHKLLNLVRYVFKKINKIKSRNDKGGYEI